MITGMSRVRGSALIRSSTAKPSSSGIMTSSRTRSKAPAASISSATRPPVAHSTAYPWRSSRRCSTARLSSMSSTTRIRAGMGAAGPAGEETGVGCRVWGVGVPGAGAPRGGVATDGPTTPSRSAALRILRTSATNARSPSPSSDSVARRIFSRGTRSVSVSASASTGRTSLRPGGSAWSMVVSASRTAARASSSAARRAACSAAVASSSSISQYPMIWLIGVRSSWRSWDSAWTVSVSGPEPLTRRGSGPAAPASCPAAARARSAWCRSRRSRPRSLSRGPRSLRGP